MLIHRNNCVHRHNTTDETFVVEDIVGVFGRIETRWMLVKFEGYDEPEYQREYQREHLAAKEGWLSRDN